MTRHGRTLVRLGAATATALLAAGAPAAYSLFDDPAPGPVVRGAPYIESRLFFGTARPDGGPAVTDRQFMAFVDKEVTPDFPDGLTVQNGRGQWRDAHGTVERERSYELILLYPVAQARTGDQKIEEIRTAYQKAFAQEAVARVDEPTRVDF
ncbi:DUF3574 domain-containing protein [Streptomyces sp. NPDC058475]|uniref:DUF3574 domain-containing protein n=1 Tax=unclassified Streptomyces TaxID=2593676 RepID=UPI00364E6C43